MEDLELIKFKENLRNRVLTIYSKHGYKKTNDCINELIKDALKQSKEVGKKELAVQIRGECTELLLEIQIREFGKKNQLEWMLSKGLTLERRDSKKGHTELDLTLFTESKIILFESKYRSGDFVLIDECNLVPRGKFGFPSNVYKQNLLHLNNLRKYLGPAILTTKINKPFSICLYMSDTSKIEDLRTPEMKSLIPLIGPNNIESYLKIFAKEKFKVWDLNKIQILIGELDSKSGENFEKHLQKVRRKD